MGRLNSRRGGQLDGVDRRRFGWRRVGRELVPLLVASAVRALLAVLAQVDFAVLAADHGPVPLAIVSICTPFTVVTVGDVARADLDPLVVLQALLVVELELTADTLQAPALVTLERSLLRAATDVTLLTYQTGVDSLF